MLSCEEWSVCVCGDTEKMIDTHPIVKTEIPHDMNTSAQDDFEKYLNKTAMVQRSPRDGNYWK